MDLSRPRQNTGFRQYRTRRERGLAKVVDRSSPVRPMRDLVESADHSSLHHATHCCTKFWRLIDWKAAGCTVLVWNLRAVSVRDRVGTGATTGAWVRGLSVADELDITAGFPTGRICRGIGFHLGAAAGSGRATATLTSGAGIPGVAN